MRYPKEIRRKFDQLILEHGKSQPGPWTIAPLTPKGVKIFENYLKMYGYDLSRFFEVMSADLIKGRIKQIRKDSMENGFFRPNFPIYLGHKEHVLDRQATSAHKARAIEEAEKNRRNHNEGMQKQINRHRDDLQNLQNFPLGTRKGDVYDYNTKAYRPRPSSSGKRRGKK